MPVGAGPLRSDVKARCLTGRVDAEAVSALFDLNVVFDAPTALRAGVRLGRKRQVRLRGWSFADADGWLSVDIATALTDTVGLLRRATQVQRLELPPLRPQSLARIPTCVLVAVPVTTAPRVLPITDLDLAIRAEASAGRVQATDLAVSVNAHVLVHADFFDIVDLSSANLALKGFDVEANGGLSCYRSRCRGLCSHSYGGVAQAVLGLT